MKTKAHPPRIIATLFFASSLLAPGPGSAQNRAGRPTAAPDRVRAEALQSALEAWAAEPMHRGVSAAVILADGEEWFGTAGVEASGTPLEPSHLIWIASITKTMTGAVILRLAERGRLDLDGPITSWLGPIDNVDPQITVRQLLNQGAVRGPPDRGGGSREERVGPRFHIGTPRAVVLTCRGPRPGSRRELGAGGQ